MKTSLDLGNSRSLDGNGQSTPFSMPNHHLLTHGVVLGMTGSGKTGLVTVLVEEALRAEIPVLIIDVKGDLPNLLLSFPDFDPKWLVPWLEPSPEESQLTSLEVAARVSQLRRDGLDAFGFGEAELRRFHDRTHLRVITPGADAGELLHVLSALERRSPRWDTDRDGARAALSAAISLILRLLGREADAAKSREHVLLSVLAERRLVAGQTADIASLLPEIVQPPFASIGALEVNAYIPKRARADLAAALNTLLAAPSFANWRQGATLDVGAWMTRVNGKTPATILSVAHLDDQERALVLGVVLEEVVAWTRNRSGSLQLQALVVFDEVYGYLPPHPASPPTKRPLVTLMKQARGFGVGIVIATQNPMDLDYRALSNAGFWCIGRLQTDADRNRVVEGLTNEAGVGQGAQALQETLKRLVPRWFVVRDSHGSGTTCLLQPRWAISLLRGPMTRQEIKLARKDRALDDPPDTVRSLNGGHCQSEEIPASIEVP